MWEEGELGDHPGRHSLVSLMVSSFPSSDHLTAEVDPISTKNLQQVLELVVQPAGARITCCNHWFSPLLDIDPISSSLLDIGLLSLRQ